MRIENQGFDHVEFVVEDLAQHSGIYERMGFEKIGERVQADRGLKTIAYAQGFVRILLTAALPGDKRAESQLPLQFMRKHAEGICVLAIEVDDAKGAHDETVARGARSARAPITFEGPEGRIMLAEIWTPGDVRYRFVQRELRGGFDKPGFLDEGLVAKRLESPSPNGIRVIDHLTNNVPMGELELWRDWYAKIFGFVVTRHFKISTGRTGLESDVVQSADYKIKVPINVATEPESQVQEFVKRMKGAGVQHLALLTTDIVHCLRQLRERSFKFLTVPHTYYEVVPNRVPGVKEDLRLMEDLGILLDGDETGYLLQIFSEEIVGPFFFEYIQRRGHKGFGEGNFNALFEAIERDQVRRGVL